MNILNFFIGGILGYSVSKIIERELINLRNQKKNRLIEESIKREYLLQVERVKSDYKQFLEDENE